MLWLSYAAQPDAPEGGDAALHVPRVDPAEQVVRVLPHDRLLDAGHLRGRQSLELCEGDSGALWQLAHNLLRDGDDGAVCRTLHVLREHRPDPSLYLGDGERAVPRRVPGLEESSCQHAAWLHRAAHRLVVLGRQEPAGVRPDHQRLSYSLSNKTLQQGEYISVGRGGCVDDGLGRPSRHQHTRTLGESVSSSRELVWTLRLHRTLPRTMWWECDAQRCVPTAAAVCPFSTVRE
mmetsp:Transcript_8101/g.26983  ORF Transcript_8101/g.26983 Transcript_8101/m.26983 type:complete len:234 (-) Transcript_8101:1030-1731(-)